MVLDRIYARGGEYAAATERKQCACGYGETKAILAQIPSESRSLDLLIFDALMRCFYTDNKYKWDVQQEDDPSPQQVKLSELMLCRIPGRLRYGTTI